MFIFQLHRLSFAPCFQVLSRLGIGATCAASICLLGVIIFVCDFGRTISHDGAPHVPSWDFRKIDNGLLALRDNFLEEAPSLLRSLGVRAKNSRPDNLYNPMSPQMVLEIKGSPETRAVASGERLFLHWEPSYTGEKTRNGPPAPPNWGAENSCFTLTPFVFPDAQDTGSVFVKIALKEGSAEEVKEIPFLIEGIAQENSLGEQKEQWLESLRMAKFWTKDLFLELYGGRELENRCEDFKIAIEAKNGLQILRVREGEFLIYQDECWRVASLQEAAKKPLAQILKQEEGRLMLHVWDSSGFISRVISLPSASSSNILSKIDLEFLSPRLRNSSEVSCLLGKRRVVLKPGDWWIKEENRRWRSLKRVNEIDDVLGFRYNGELFVVDSLDKVQGRSLLKGRLFDRTRQSVQVISLPVAEGRIGGSAKPQTQASLDAKKTIQESQRRAPIPLVRRADEEQHL